MRYTIDQVVIEIPHVIIELTGEDMDGTTHTALIGITHTSSQLILNLSQNRRMFIEITEGGRIVAHLYDDPEPDQPVRWAKHVGSLDLAASETHTD